MGRGYQGVVLVALGVKARVGAWCARMVGLQKGRPSWLPTPPNRAHRRVTAALNDMARQIDATEQVRRQMLTDLAHEMRTPLANLSVISESLSDDIRKVDRRTLNLIDREIGRLTRLADDLSAVSRAEEGQFDLDFEDCDISEVVVAAVQSQRSRIQGRELSFNTRLPDTPCIRRIDRDKIGQVLDNILRNACQHTPDGGGIFVSVTPIGPSKVRIDIADNGNGISEKDLPHIFERFYRGDASRRRDQGAGSGVGLAITRAIVRTHGGSLTAMSAGIGQGATFTLEL